MRPLSTCTVGRGSRRNIDSAVMLLPQPDSPTSPSISPARIVSEIFCSTGQR
jgi:hypothetical protein